MEGHLRQSTLMKTNGTLNGVESKSDEIGYHPISKMLKRNKELWDLFTTCEEYKPPMLDQHGRFPHYLSNNRFIFDPRVSKLLIESGLNVEYPENKKFAICLTHDIDTVYYSRSILGSTYSAFKYLKDGHVKDALKMPFHKLYKKWNPLWNFKKIMALEDKYGAKSSFYILSLSKSDKDFNYELEDLEHELGNIIDCDWEVGLHGGHNAYNSLDQLKIEKTNLEILLGKNVIGYRNHFLKFKVPYTWELLSKAGFKYDATFGYADCVGFRNGMCHPFKPFNLNTNNTIDMLEIPLTIMDCTLFDYMKQDIKGAWETTKMLIDTVEKYNGVITILWHNTYMLGDKLRFYDKILKYCSGKNAWLTSGANIYNWWSRDNI